MIHVDLFERAGTVWTFTDQIESRSPSLMVREMAYIIDTPTRLQSSGRTATLKAVVTGNSREDLFEVKKAIESGEVFIPRTQDGRRRIEAAKPLSDIPLSRQAKLHVAAENWDGPGLVGELAEPILIARGTIHNFSGHTENSGKSPGTADFLANMVVGFSTMQDAKHAERLLNSLGFRDLAVTRLFDELPDRVGLSAA